MIVASVFYNIIIYTVRLEQGRTMLSITTEASKINRIDLIIQKILSFGILATKSQKSSCQSKQLYFLA